MATITKFTLVELVDSAAGKPTVQAWSPGAYEQPGLSTAHKILGVAMTDSNYEEPLAVMKHGYLRGVTNPGAAWAVGDILYGQSDGSVAKTRPAAPLPLVVVGTVFADEGGGLVTVDVNVRVMPSLGELSGVSVETPADKDVFIYKVSTHVWEPRQLDHNGDIAGLTTAGAHPATAITNTPAGGIAATTVQAAIDELEQEKAGLVLFYSLGGF